MFAKCSNLLRYNKHQIEQPFRTVCHTIVCKNKLLVSDKLSLNEQLHMLSSQLNHSTLRHHISSLTHRSLVPFKMTTYPAWNAFHKTTSAEPCPPNCTICLEPLKITPSDAASNGEHAVTIDVCGHVFGRECLATWMREHNTCPVCRIEFFTQPEPIVQSQVRVHIPQHFALDVYALGDSSLEVSINSAVQSMRSLQVDAGQESRDERDESDQARRGGRSSRGIRRFLA